MCVKISGAVHSQHSRRALVARSRARSCGTIFRVVVLFDSSVLPSHERADAYDSALNSVIFPAMVRLGSDGGEAYARVEAWGLGGGIGVVQTVTSGQKLARTASQIRRAPMEDLSFGITLAGNSLVRQNDRVYGIAGAVNPIHGMEPFEVDFRPVGGRETSLCANIGLQRLGLPMDVVRTALPNLPRSPLYSLFQGHLSGLVAAAAKVEDTPAATMLGSATIELARALVASASTHDRLAFESLTDVLGLRIDDYIRRHLTDHSLSAARIAAEHSISVRYLYTLFARRGQSLEQQILRERLEYARVQLTHAAVSGRSIQSVAYGCGFVHPQHFSRRFRETYGLTPRQWREMHRPGSQQASEQEPRRSG
jgi:AraC-like DNA-binding protein